MILNFDSVANLIKNNKRSKNNYKKYLNVEKMLLKMIWNYLFVKMNVGPQITVQ